MAARQTLVMVPGLVCDGAVWAHQRAGLADIADCIVTDALAHETMAGMADEVLASTPEPFAIAGFSMGAYVALEVARRAPKRVTRMALIDAGVAADTAEQAAHRRRVIADCENGRFAAVLEAMLPQLLHPVRLTEPLADLVRAMGARVGAAAYARRMRAILGRLDGRVVLDGLDVPVRVIWGREDVLAPLARGEAAAAAARRGRLSIVEDCGHMPPLERPQAATALLRDWLLYD
ncbi:MAG: alpha/beta fold hydrolase [Alphaproteobacteria bacterium]|nr:alpha/beta fold hydrolase [Alphaproteobacteria bacterium]